MLQDSTSLLRSSRWHSCVIYWATASFDNYTIRETQYNVIAADALISVILHARSGSASQDLVACAANEATGRAC
jgi:hypothetical protein